MRRSNRTPPSERFFRYGLKYPVTLRLVAAAAAVWLCAALPAPDWVVMAAAGVFTVLSIGLWAWTESTPDGSSRAQRRISRQRRESGRAQATALLAVTCVVVGLAAVGVSAARMLGTPDEGAVSGRVKIVSDPVQSASGWWRAAASTDDGPVTLLSREELPEAGSTAQADLSLTREASQATGFVNSMRDVRGPVGMWRVRRDVRQEFHAAVAGGSAGAGLVPGLVLGDRTTADDALLEDMKIASLTHVSAVSGTHLAIVAMTALWLARWISHRPLSATAVAVVLVAGFVFIVGPAPSVIRAAGMGLVGAYAVVRGTGKRSLALIAAAVIGVLITRPELSSSIGFTLSVCAAGALIVLSQPMTTALCRWMPPFAANLLAVPVCAQLGVFPVLLTIDSQPSLWSIPANVVAVPALGPIVIGGLAVLVSGGLHLLTGWAVFGYFADGVGWLLQWPAQWIALVSHTAAGLPGAVLPWAAGTLGIVVAVVLGVSVGVAVIGFRKVRIRRIAAAVAVGALVLGMGLPLIHRPAGDWTVAFCDVGQGSATAVRLSAEHALLVDAGPDEAKLADCLSALGVRQTSVIISHFDADHYAGLRAATTGGRTVAAVWASAPSLADPRAREVQALTGHEVRGLTEGMAFSSGDVRWEVLWPPPDMAEQTDGRNQISAVIQIETAGVSVLVTGDVEEDGQRAMAAESIQADILTAPHHGSRFIDPSFFAQVGASAGIVSVGANNRYGHPTRQALDAFGSVPVLRTDECGTVVLDRDAQLRGLGGCTGSVSG